MSRSINLFLISLIPLLFTLSVFAEETKVAPPITTSTQTTKQTSKPIAITSDRLEARNEFSEISFIGNVVAKNDELTILSNILKINYSENEEIESIIATGTVKIVKNLDTAYADSATYFQESQLIQLSGNAKVERQGSTIQGDSIQISVKDEMSIIESDPGKRIKAVIMPGGGE